MIKIKIFSKTTQGYLLAIATVLIWTGFILISRMGGKTSLSSYDIFALRVGVASLILLPFIKDIKLNVWLDIRLWILTLLGGILYGLFIYTGFKFSPVAHASILLSGMQPFLVTGIAFFISRDKPKPIGILGLCMIALGVFCMLIPYISTHTSTSLLGDMLVLGASVVWALYSVLAKSWNYNPWLLTRFVAIGSAIIFLPIYIIALPKHLNEVPSSTLIIQGLYQGIGPTIIAMLCFLRAVSILGPVKVGAIISFVPVLASILAIPLLNESMTNLLLLGLISVSLGSLVVVISKK